MIHNEFNLLEMRQHTPSGKIFVPLQNFVFRVDTHVKGYLTIILNITNTNFFIDIMVTDVINRLSIKILPILTDTEILIGLCERAIYNMQNSTDVNLQLSKYTVYKNAINTAIDFAVDNLICKIANAESNNTNRIIKLKYLILKLQNDYCNNYELMNAKCKLDELITEEAQNRFLTHKANIIKKQFRKSISDPSYTICRSRLLREHNEFP
jgi:hypothetical protein